MPDTGVSVDQSQCESKRFCREIIRRRPEQMSRQDGDQVVVKDENPELEEEPQSTAVDAFDHVVVGLQVRGENVMEIIAAIEGEAACGRREENILSLRPPALPLFLSHACAVI